MYCNNCGRLLEDDVVSCPYCGQLMDPRYASQNVDNAASFTAEATKEKENGAQQVLIWGLIGMIVSIVVFAPLGLALSIVALIKAKKYKRAFGELDSNAQLGNIFAIIGAVVGGLATVPVIIMLLIVLFYFIIYIVMIVGILVGAMQSAVLIPLI